MELRAEDTNIILPPLDLIAALKPADYAECELNRLESLWKSSDNDPEGQLARADKMVKVAEQGDLALVSPACVSMVYERQGEPLIDLGQSQRGTEALRQAANLQSDENAKVLLNEMAVEALPKL